MKLLMLAQAVSGFIDVPGRLKKYSSSSSTTRRSHVLSQLECVASGRGNSRLPLPKGFALPFPFASFLDRWGPCEGAIGAEGSVFDGASGTWSNRDQ